MEIGVPKEISAGEHRVALVPDSAARLVQAGHHVIIETGAGMEAYFDDRAYSDAGAQIAPDAATLYARAELLLKVRAPSCTPERSSDELDLLREGTILVALLQPLADPARMRRLAERNITSFSMDAIPRITRAQAMDALSAMSTVAGYRAVLLAAERLPRFFPLLMTAAGTVTPARVLILGAGVAGLQAIATARRLGAMVQAFDTRHVVREQVESLGAKFLALPLEENAEGQGGYARELSEESHARELALLRDPVREADVIITTAMIPGARAPRLLSEEMVATMRPGSVIVDLAAESGGNCALTVAGERIVAHGITIDGPLNLPATMPIHASQLYARTLLAFVTHLLDNGLATDARSGKMEINLEDEIVSSTCITHAGRIVHSATRDRCAMERGETTADDRQPAS